MCVVRGHRTIIRIKKKKIADNPLVRDVACYWKKINKSFNGTCITTCQADVFVNYVVRHFVQLEVEDDLCLLD